MAARHESYTLALVLAVAAALAVAGARPYAGSWNDGSRLASVENLVDHGTLAIDDSIFVAVPPASDPTAPQPYRGPALEHGTLDKLFIDGHFYSDKSPVPTLLLAAVYKLLQLISGLRASLHPGLFCWCMTLASSGLAYIVAVLCVFRLGRVVRLPLGWRVLLTASFGLATVAVVYVQHVNNHMFLLAVAAALMLQAAQLMGPVPLWRLLLLGNLAGLSYAIDLGAGPPLLACTGLFVAWRCGRQWTGSAWFVLGTIPWLTLHHALNYAVGGTFGPANAVADYFQWPGCPFTAANLTGAWHHRDLPSFAIYTAALLFSKRGFVEHNLPVFLLVPALVLCLRGRFRFQDRQTAAVWPVMLLAAGWSLATWLLYAASSRNYSGMNCSIRWLVPLLAPAYYALAVLLVRWPACRPAFLALSAWGAVLMGIAWWYGPWIAHMVPGYWFIQVAAMATWGYVSWRRAGTKPVQAGRGLQPPHFILQRREVIATVEDAVHGEVS